MSPVGIDDDSDSPRNEIRVGIILLAAFFLGFGGWAALAPLDAGVSAPGVIAVAGNRQTIQHRDGGTISRLLVAEGDRVARGQVLIELTTTELKSQERALVGQSIELQALRARLVAEASDAATIERPQDWANLPSDYAVDADAVLTRQTHERSTRQAATDAQLAVLKQRQAQLRSRIQGQNQQMASVGRQLELIADELVGLQTLSRKGLVPLTRVRALERTQAELEGQRGELLAATQQANEAIGESRLQAISLEQDRAQSVASDLRQTDTALAELTPKVDGIRSQLEATRIRAPAGGVVVGLRIFTVGGVVRPGEPILDVIPDTQPLVVEARVKPQDADDLRRGMKTQVRFVSVANRSLPQLYGVVSRVSADRFTDDRSGQPYFLTEVTVARSELARLERASSGAKLQVGLPVEIVVPIRKRTALQYLVEPLDHRLWRAFREQ